MKLNNARLKTLPLDKSFCEGVNLYFTRTSLERGKWSFRYQRLGKKREMGLCPYPAIRLTDARQRVSSENTHNTVIPAINPSQYGPFVVNLSHSLPKLGQRLHWPFLRHDG